MEVIALASKIRDEMLMVESLRVVVVSGRVCDDVGGSI